MISVFLNLIDTPAEKDKFKALYDEYKDLLYWIALKKVHNTEDAEDCVQETFFYVAKNFNKIDDVYSKRTKAYLSTIITGFAIDRYNESNKIDVISSDDENGAFGNELSQLKYFENFDRIYLTTVIKNVLDEDSRVFLYLKYIYGYKSYEIAEIYNIKDSYVRKKLQYARTKLRKHLETRIS